MSNIDNRVRPKVKLISHTPHPIDLIAKCAAVCYDSEPKTSTVIHCVKSGHTSILEHANFTFQIENVSRSLLAQLTRHRVGVAFNVISQRYVSMENTPFVTPRAIKSTTTTVNAISIIQNTFDNIRNDYLELRDIGVSKEDARCILPNACSCKIIMTINLRALCHLCNERLCSKAQLEIREMVQNMKGCILNLEDIPNDFKQFMKNKMLVPKCCTYAVEHCPESKGCGLRLSANEINQYIKERNEPIEFDS